MLVENNEGEFSTVLYIFTKFWYAVQNLYKSVDHIQRCTKQVEYFSSCEG